MTASQEYFEEKAKIDLLLNQGFKITKVTENLDGATVVFESANQRNHEVLLIETADARKYFSSVMVSLQKNLTMAE
ncbi:hypothetical protein QUF79_15455 [Fictibacillus enclensis]|uniref:hypothetical protein n=1 Tax=Fictibacillus enclensis TaxID=1017270 RepID=UPI0025A11A83|nr:hypothetical protein [Fictibacillus enclensis]MDM5199413.1 hypothetical protein [Fictibacillus enclensis]